jgi:hypothetical protein
MSLQITLYNAGKYQVLFVINFHIWLLLLPGLKMFHNNKIIEHLV